MRKPGLSRVVMAVLLGLAAGACAAPAPYIYNKGEFDRSVPGFGQKPETVYRAVVCYGRRGTTPKQVVDLAVAECARYGKSARFSHQDYLVCPLATPVSAHYDCLGGDSAEGN